jgi:iron complex outermembrane recepter protein
MDAATGSVRTRRLPRARLGLLCWTISSLLAAPRLGAQESPAPELEQIFVTGSRIARPDFESASPIVSITADAFERTSALSVESVLSKLPQFTPYFGSTSNNPANGGQSNVQLRGLGAAATLVLLDGRRLIPANGNGVVDVSIIPPSLVESVEVVSGGASAVYGSDAIAGVVNFKLRNSFEGIQLDGNWGTTEDGDGTEQSIGITGGRSFADGRGKAFGYAGYSEREAVRQSEREFSRVTLTYFGPGAGGVGPGGAFLPGGSGFIPEGRTAPAPTQRPSQSAFETLFATYGYAAGTVPLQNNSFGFNADGSVFTVGNLTPGSVANFRGEQDPDLANDRLYTYNFAPWNYLQLPLERVSAFGRMTWEVGPTAELYAQALFASYSADTALAPTSVLGLRLPTTNPFIPEDFAFLLASRAAPAADILLGKRLIELGPRLSSNENDAFQVTAGSRGHVFGGWQYDAYVQYGSYDSDETQSGNALRSKILELTFAPDGGQAACGGLNVFGPGSISRECAAYIAAGGTNRAGYDQTIAEVSMTGAVLALPAGDLSLALGVMHKRDEYVYRADPIASVTLPDGQVDIQGFNASDDIEGSDHNTDIYVEALVPILASRAGAERLEAVLGYRHSEYASAGGVDSYKMELLYEPVSAVRLRGSFQHAVRAPSIFELYQPLLPLAYANNALQGSVLDPCTAGSPQRTGADATQVEALCLAQGLPASTRYARPASLSFTSHCCHSPMQTMRCKAPCSTPVPRAARSAPAQMPRRSRRCAWPRACRPIGWQGSRIRTGFIKVSVAATRSWDRRRPTR